MWLIEGIRDVSGALFEPVTVSYIPSMLQFLWNSYIWETAICAPANLWFIHIDKDLRMS